MTAFRQSVEAMIPALRRYARALARDADVADDLVQDTLVRALRSERLFLGGDVRSWLYTILTNLNKNRRRSLARRPQFMPLLDNNPDPRIPVTEDELHAYVDNELPAERRGDVEAWLAAHADDAERVRSWRTMAEALHARYDSVADEVVPKRLEIERLVRQPRNWIYGAIAATLVAFIAGGGVGLPARGAAASPSTFQNFTLDALDAHRLYVVEVRHPVEVPGSERAHLQQWLTK